MARVKVVGIRETDFQPENAKEPIVGKTLYFLTTDDKTKGYVSDRAFVQNAKFVNHIFPEPNDEVNLEYNRYGKVDFVEVLTTGKG